MNIELLERHASFKNSHIITEITQPFLDQHHLKHFAYAKHFDNGTGYCLTTHPEFALDYHRYKLYKLAKFEKETSDQSSTSILWLAASESSQPLFKYAKDYYSIANGITILKKNAESMEQFYFAADKNNVAANNFYLNNLDILKKFNSYFLENIQPLQLICDANPLPNISSSPPHIPGNICLSPREQQILNLVVRGKTAREAAVLLQLSKRTIEKHFDNIKRKFNVKCKSELIEKAIFLEIVNI